MTHGPFPDRASSTSHLEKTYLFTDLLKGISLTLESLRVFLLEIDTHTLRSTDPQEYGSEDTVSDTEVAGTTADLPVQGPMSKINVVQTV